ncbi:MAG: peptidoglycan DD-metalloendopeptidase family protein [Acidimicrobiia bacterium]
MKRTARIIAGIVVLSLAVPAVAEVTDDDLAHAEGEIRRIMAEAQELGDAVQEAWARQAELENEITRLQASVEFAQLQINRTEDRLEEVAVELYMGTTATASLSMLLTSDSDEVGAGFQYLKEVSGFDGSVITQLRVFRDELDRQSEQLAAAAAEEEAVSIELQQAAEQLQEKLQQAQEFYDQLSEQRRQEEAARRAAEEAARRAAEEAARRAAEEAARRAAEEAARTTTVPSTTTTTVATTTTTAAATTTTTSDEGGVTTTTTTVPASSGEGVCPVAGPVTFTDTWGAPRSGGRTHEGVDMMSARGTPIVALYDAVIKRISINNLGGNALWLKDDKGDEYYYAHMDSYGDIRVGQRVPEGYVVGYNGSSGNSPDWLPHLHLEWHPDGGAAVNPYPLVKDLCG